MKVFVIEHNSDGRASYVSVNKGKNGEIGCDLVLDPSHGKIFLSQDDAIVWLKVNINSSGHGFFSIVERDRAEDKFSALLSSGIRLGSLKTLDRDLSREYNGEQGVDLIDWWISYRLCPDPENYVSQDCLETWPLLREEFKHIWDIERCDYADCKPVILCVYSYKDGKFEDFEKEIKLGINVVESRCGSEGRLYMPVFNGRYAGCIEPSAHISRSAYDVWNLSTVWGQSIVKGGSLRDVFNHIVKHCWCER
jgi:hypothetical protein